MRIAAIDLGTNSFHLLVVEAHPDGTFLPLVREKEMLRLGDAVSREGRIGARLMGEAVAAVRRFAAMAEGIGCDEIVACGTSAIREADNGSELVDRIEAETGIRPRVISGRDEARLIFAAVRASVLLDPSPALCFDLGGGSLEVMVGDRAGLLWSTSLKLGVARLTAELVDSDPLSEHDQRRLRDRLTGLLAPVADVAADLGPKLAVGTSGTFCDLARMVAAARNGGPPVSVNQLCISRQDFLAVHEQVLAATAAERLRMSGLDARRVDLIPAGSMVLATAMELFGFDEFVVSEWALREGIVLDAIGHHDPADWTGDPRAMRRASVISLARRCGWDEAHGTQVAQLAGDLFDRTIPLHRLSGVDRELLEYAGLLHDIGEHVSTSSHHKHTAYLIEHGSLRGFDPEEVLALAALARYHRRSEPKPSHEPFASLPPERQERVTKLAALLRLADGLDRAHQGAVEGIDVEIAADRVRVDVHARGEVDLELWGARRKRALFERLFERRVEVVAPRS
ncbi:MAG TPA: Ppx/GppA phosphatase family protein [Acidimicrobiales bacterium]|nr:Ppx/GppA phosphatase family protein [Acidimicrobiales bacterium]